MIKVYYEVVTGPAGQPRDWARDRSLYIKDLRFVIVDYDKAGQIAREDRGPPAVRGLVQQTR